MITEDYIPKKNFSGRSDRGENRIFMIYILKKQRGNCETGWGNLNRWGKIPHCLQNKLSPCDMDEGTRNFCRITAFTDFPACEYHSKSIAFFLSQSYVRI